MLHVAAVDHVELSVLVEDVAPDVAAHHHGAGERNCGVEEVLILPQWRQHMGVNTTQEGWLEILNIKMNIKPDSSSALTSNSDSVGISTEVSNVLLDPS